MYFSSIALTFLLFNLSSVAVKSFFNNHFTTKRLLKTSIFQNQFPLKMSEPIFNQEEETWPTPSIEAVKTSFAEMELAKLNFDDFEKYIEYWPINIANMYRDMYIQLNNTNNINPST